MGQQWERCDDDIREFVTGIVRGFRDFLGVNLTGTYLHGSLASGSYYRAKSDIDLLVVVKEPLVEDERRRFALLCISLSDKRPTLGDIELSVILEFNAREFVHPLPYEVHYSSAHRDRILAGRQDYTRNGTDRDLAAHSTVVKARGVRLDGAPISEVFGKVPFEDYVDAILEDLDSVLEGDNILKTPFYGVLNACRVFQVIEEAEGTVPSKVEGAAWALDHLPSEYKPFIHKVLGSYQSATLISQAERRTAGLAWDEGEMRAFRDYVSKRRNEL